MAGLVHTPPPPSFSGVEVLLAPPARRRDPGEGPGGDGLRGAGERITAIFIDLCEDPRWRRRVIRFVRAKADGALSGRLFFAMVSRLVFRPALAARRVDEAAIKIELITGHLAAVAVMRYMSKVEPIASMPRDELVRRVSPSVQAILDG